MDLGIVNVVLGDNVGSQLNPISAHRKKSYKEGTIFGPDPTSCTFWASATRSLEP